MSKKATSSSSLKGARNTVLTFRNGIRTIDPKKASKFSSVTEELKPTSDDLVALAQQESKPREERTTKKMWTFWGIALLTVIIGYFLFEIQDVIFMILAAYVISIALEGIIYWFEKHIRTRGGSIAITYILVVIFCISGFCIIIPFLASQTSVFVGDMVRHITDLQQNIHTNGIDVVIQESSWLPDTIKSSVVSRLHDPALGTNLTNFVMDNLSYLVDSLSKYAKSLGGIMVSLTGAIVNVLLSGILMLTLCVLFSASQRSVINFIVGLSGKKKTQTQLKLYNIYSTLSSWLQSQLLMCLFIGSAAYLGLWIMDWCGMPLPQKGVLALIAGLFEIIPYLGPLLGGLPAALLALMYYGFRGVIVVILVYGTIQQLENQVLIPLVMSKTLGVSALVTFISMMIGGIIMGFAGILLAVPLAVIVTVLFQRPDQLKVNNGKSPLEIPPSSLKKEKASA